MPSSITPNHSHFGRPNGRVRASAPRPMHEVAVPSDAIAKRAYNKFNARL
jgi:hypothetical protein